MNGVARLIVSMGMLASLCGCARDTQKVSARDTVVTRTAATTPAVTAPLAHAQPVLGPDSLPLAAYAGVPGWYIPFSRLGSSDTAGTSLAPALVEGANLRIFVHPPNDSWRRVRLRPAALLFDGGQADVHVVAADSMRQPRHGANYLSPVDVALTPLPAGTGWLAASWLLPRRISGAARLSPHRAAFGDTAIVWAADGVALLLRRTSATSALLSARTVNGAVVPLRAIAIDRAADSSMGLKPDSVLHLSGKRDWRIPSVGTVFRLGPSGPWVFVLVESGYECTNDRLVRVDSTTAHFLDDDDHYYECMT